MRAIIVGAGIAGLVAARQLGLAGWQVQVIERSAAPRPDGYMMDFFGPGVQASERIGLYPYLAEVSYQVRATPLTDPTEEVEFHGDLLIGADGLHSVVRTEVFGPEAAYLRDLGMRAAAYIVDEPQINAHTASRFMLTDSIGRTAGYYGLRGGRVAIFLVYRPEPGEARPLRERLRAAFTGLGTDVDRLLQLCPEHPYDDAVAQVVMPRLDAGRVVLLGDAGGAVSLLAGQGGSLAVAGAAALGQTLAPVHDPQQLPAALAGFSAHWLLTVRAAQGSGRRAAASFLPATKPRLLARRWVLKLANLPVVDRIMARQIISRIAS